MHKLTIITICYNDRVGLERTVASVLKQTTQDFEYVVIDGGSTDGSKEFIEQNKANFTRWVSEKDNGIYDAQNKGWRMARTDFVHFLNAGDVFASDNVVTRVLPALKVDIDVAYGDAQLIKNGYVTRTKHHPQDLTSAYLIKETIAHQAQFIRRTLLETAGGYDLRYPIAADYAFVANMFWKQKVRFAALGFIVCAFDLSGQSSNPSNREAMAQERKAIQRAYAPVLWYKVYHSYAALNRFIGR